MPRPRRAAAEKPEGHYALTPVGRKRKKSVDKTQKPRQRKKKNQSEGDEMSIDTSPPGPSRKQDERKDESEGDEMSIDTSPPGPTRKQDKGKGQAEEDPTVRDTPPPAQEDPKGKGRAERDPTLIPTDATKFGRIKVIAPKSVDPAALALDLKNSYVGKIPAPKRPDRPARQKRWQQPASNPIEFIEDVPKGWSFDEPDLDPDDLDAQIARCRERISDNIMVHQFKFNLEELLQRQGRRNKMMADEQPGLSWPVVQRLKTLDAMSKWLDTTDDEYEMTANVKSLTQAYRSGQLEWNAGLVTYWSKGVQLCQPRPFRWNEYDIISKKHHGQKSFWVEGMHGPGPTSQMMHWVTRSNGVVGMGYMNICLKIGDLPDRQAKPIEMEFLDDTGAAFIQINRTDMDELLDINMDTNGNIPPAPTLIGLAALYLANGEETFFAVIRLEANLWDQSLSSFMSTKWNSVPVAILDDRPAGQKAHRLAGRWPRFRMYTASAPFGTCQTFFGDTHP